VSKRNQRTQRRENSLATNPPAQPIPPEASASDASQTSGDQDPKIDAIYGDERKELAKGQINAIEKYDQYMIALATGALSLSILFMEKLATKPPPESLNLIVQSWMLFAISLVAVLFSYLLASHSWKIEIEIFDIVYCERTGQTLTTVLAKRRSRKNWQVNPLNRWINVSNWFGFFAFAGGVLFFLLFAYAIMVGRAKEGNMPNNETRETKKSDREERASPAIPPRILPPKEQPKPQSEPKKDK
jgi:TRAP-type C4-dicarboxylate transport system permease small subunit